MPSARSDWTSYREALTDFIIRSSAPGSDALILGAGKCNDFDTALLQSHFRSLTLIDRNSAENVSELDLLGLNDNNYTELAHAVLSSCADPGKVAAALDRFFSKIYFPDIPEYDCIIAAGLHSQLCVVPAAMILSASHSFGTDPSCVLDRIKLENDRLIPAFDDFLLSHTRNNLISACEKGPVEGALQAIRDLHSRNILAETELIWPFDILQKVIYRMDVMSVCPE